MSSTNPFASLFGKSPFKALQVHMRVALECAHTIPPLFEALAAGDQDAVVATKDKIFQKEAEADTIKNDMRGALQKACLCPLTGVIFWKCCKCRIQSPTRPRISPGYWSNAAWKYRAS